MQHLSIQDPQGAKQGLSNISSLPVDFRSATRAGGSPVKPVRDGTRARGCEEAHAIQQLLPAKHASTSSVYGSHRLQPSKPVVSPMRHESSPAKHAMTAAMPGTHQLQPTRRVVSPARHESLPARHMMPPAMHVMPPARHESLPARHVMPPAMHVTLPAKYQSPPARLSPSHGRHTAKFTAFPSDQHGRSSKRGESYTDRTHPADPWVGHMGPTCALSGSMGKQDVASPKGMDQTWLRYLARAKEKQGLQRTTAITAVRSMTSKQVRKATPSADVPIIGSTCQTTSSRCMFHG